MTPTLSNLFFLIVLLSGFAEACMPGYEAEREKLHEYLGIEWVPMGLHDAAESEKPIRHSHDLNCNFDHPSECRWRNARGSVDSLDFHLFKKTEHTEFPILQVRPGPSKVREGDQLIFVGDRKRIEKSAIYYSSPIPCQNSTGVLTFTFWVYNEARVEVVIVELDSSGNVIVLPEKPYVDCGTVHLNTECSVNIPPKEVPFRLGIRAYDIKNPEGSFVMIDNILYDASLCKVNIDLGDDFQTNPLITRSEGEPVKASSELNCDSFAMDCRWRDGGNGTSIWKRADNAPSHDIFFNATGTYVTPKGPFAFYYIEQNSKAPYRHLKSDPVECQSDQEAVLSMRFWATKDVMMSVCAVNMEMVDLECHNVPMSQSPSPVEFRFQQTRSFFFIVRVDSVNPDFDSMIAIDDISYRAVLCSEALSVHDFGSSYYITPLLSLILNKPIYNSKDLGCSFDRRGIDCNWANLKNGDEVQWEVGSGPINTHKFLSLTQSSILPDGEFGVINFTQPGQSGSLVSETIKCNLNQSTLSFRYWTTGQTSLSVCLLDGRSPEVIDCQKVTVTQQGGPLLTDIPTLSHPFRISFRAAADGIGMVLIDDILFNGVVCPSLRQHGSKTKTLSSLTSAPDSNVCRLLSCDFTGNTPCLYHSDRIPKSLSMFKVQNNRMETTLFEKGAVAILESPIFHLNAPARLHFDYVKQYGNVTLFVCQDSSERELDKCFPIDSEESKAEWKHDFMAVLPSDTKLYWIAKLGQNAKKARVAIDNIVMTDEDDNKIC